MSVRAHLVKEIRYSDTESFNLWHHNAVTAWLEENTHFYSRINTDCGGIGEVSVQDIERMLAEIGGKLDVETRLQLRADVAWTKANGGDWLEYDCF